MAFSLYLTSFIFAGFNDSEYKLEKNVFLKFIISLWISQWLEMYSMFNK